MRCYLETEIRAERGCMSVSDTRPAILVSYYYWRQWARCRFVARWQRPFPYRQMMLDSGAFSAQSHGVEIDVQDYIRFVKWVQEREPEIVEIVALDVIGDWEASLRNYEAMRTAGIDAIPTYHVGDPPGMLYQLASEYDKIALGGMVGYPQRRDWLRRCFEEVWPKKIHGLGITNERVLLELPFHSVDSTNWKVKPVRFGAWQRFAGSGWRGDGPGSEGSLTGEALGQVRIEERARARWKSEWRELGGDPSPTVHLVMTGDDCEFPVIEEVSACLSN